MPNNEEVLSDQIATLLQSVRRDGPEPEEAPEQPPEGAPDETATPDEEPIPRARFREVYKRWKTEERSNQQTALELAQLKSEMAQIRSSFEQQRVAFEQRFAEPEPDIHSDPDAWKTWNTQQIDQRELRIQGQLRQQRLVDQRDVMRDIHPDFDDMIRSIATELTSNPMLADRFATESNPPRAIYNYAKSRAKQPSGGDAPENPDDFEVNFPDLEPSGRQTPKGQKTPPMTKEERLVAKRLGIDDKDWGKARSDYAAQRKELGFE
jgi:hypothetical protein